MAPLTADAEDDKPQFLNMDLHVESREDLTPLAAALAAAVCGWQDWRHRGTRFLHGSLGLRQESPSALILAVSTRLKRLRGAARAAWTGAKVREFDIGIQAGFANRAGEWVVNADAVQTAAGVGAQLRITVYPPEPTPAPQRKSTKSKQ